MGKINDIDLSNWKESEVWTDSLWLIEERDKSGKHDGFYHGNFIPQIPEQLIKKYTKRGDTVIDLFIGSGTTAYVCEQTRRNLIGVDIQPEMVQHVLSKLDQRQDYFSEVLVGNSANPEICQNILRILDSHGQDSAQLVILHPPYADIIKFSDDKNDLSNADTIQDFIERFAMVVSNAAKVLEKGRYLAVVMGDVYKKSQWVPLGFYCMSAVQEQGFILKSIIVKNMSGNRGKRHSEGIWKYRSLANDYYIFKHEYIFVFKKG